MPPGTEIKIFDAACKFGVAICYDMVFPKVAEKLVKKGAQILFFSKQDRDQRNKSLADIRKGKIFRK